MEQALASLTEIQDMLRAEQAALLKAKVPPSAYLSVAIGAIAATRDNIRHELDRRAAVPKPAAEAEG